VLLTEGEMALQGVIGKLIEIERFYRMEMNAQKKKSNKNFKINISSKSYDRPKTTGKCGILNI
jgi:hypothetical protein